MLVVPRIRRGTTLQISDRIASGSSLQFSPSSIVLLDEVKVNGSGRHMRFRPDECAIDALKEETDWLLTMERRPDDRVTY